MTRTQKGPNGEQQRVTFERDFKNETELNKFLKDFELNLNKNQHQQHNNNHHHSSHHHPFQSSTNSSHPRSSHSSNATTPSACPTPSSTTKTTSSTLSEDLIKSPGFVCRTQPRHYIFSKKKLKNFYKPFYIFLLQKKF